MRARRSCASRSAGGWASWACELDLEANGRAEPDATISAADSTVQVRVVPAREDIVAAREARELV